MKKGLLIILSGPSGVGKGTVRKVVMEDESLHLAYSISMTTRKPRNLELNGIDYFFVSKEEFEKNIEKDNLLEHAYFVGNYYGTPADYVEKLRNEGKNVILEIEIEGATQVMKKCKSDGAFSIFLIPPSLKALEDRIRGRKSESDDIILERLEKAKREMDLKDRYDYVVLNDDVERAAKEIRDIIRLRINQNM